MKTWLLSPLRLFLYKPQRDEPSVTVTSVSGAVGLILMGCQEQETICLAADKPVKLGFTENVDIHSEAVANVRAEVLPRLLKATFHPFGPYSGFPHIHQACTKV